MATETKISVSKQELRDERFSLLSVMLSNGLAELGYPNLTITSLVDQDDDEFGFVIRDSKEEKCTVQ